MKIFDLNSYGVQEMDAQALKDANGGGVIIPFIAGAILGGIAYDLWKEGAKYVLTQNTGWHMRAR